MENDNRKIVKLFADFSKMMGIKPPNSAKLVNWWCEGLEEMSDFNLLDLMERGFLAKSNDSNLKKMRQLLVDQVEKRQLLNTLV